MSLLFFINSALLGVGLAMDAFSVSIVNAMVEPAMKSRRRILIAGTYAFFQFLMPLIGWFCVHSFVTYFKQFEPFIPWIALLLLLFIGGKMVREGLHPEEDEDTAHQPVSFRLLMVQGIATAIDALSVGFTIADYNAVMALMASLIIAVVTYGICTAGLLIGKAVGHRISNKATIIGGIILIGIGIEIFVKGIFF